MQLCTELFDFRQQPPLLIIRKIALSDRLSQFWNPLYNGDPAYDGYDVYLKRMQEIYGRICKRMKTNAYLVVQADNLTNEQFSPLVWDLGRALSEVMTLEGEIMVNWSDAVESNNPFTQCLVFRNTGR
ncbi:hypothetical protein AMC83_CH00508 [Rhizobium phaseoli]|nr:hypothetical protein AMC83_CH00508 [Rhizobium phaseoli]